MASIPVGSREVGVAALKAEVPALVRTLREGDPEAKQSAARRLEELGPAAEQAIPALVLALDDPQVCYGALQALRRIQGAIPTSPVH
jgi:hypothetical protein